MGEINMISAILLAALNTPGITQIKTEKTSRNHTENLLETIKSDIKIKKF